MSNLRRVFQPEDQIVSTGSRYRESRRESDYTVVIFTIGLKSRFDRESYSGFKPYLISAALSRKENSLACVVAAKIRCQLIWRNRPGMRQALLAMAYCFAAFPSGRNAGLRASYTMSTCRPSQSILPSSFTVAANALRIS